MVEKTMLGDFIYQRRKELGLSQSELGDLVGVSNKAVSKWETMESNPDLKIINALATALKCNVEELLTCKMGEVKLSKYKPTKIFGYEGLELNNKEEYEFISDKKNRKGDPKLHIHFGKKLSTINCKAKGTIAIGLFSSGFFSIGLVSCGVFSLGIIAIGLFALAPILSIGLFLSLSTIAIGLGVSIGTVAIGSLAIGAIAIGVYALGAVAIGVYAHTSDTGVAIGVHEFIHNNWNKSK